MVTHARAAWQAVWYRHWLEHAGALAVALGFDLAFAVAYAIGIALGRDPLALHVLLATVAAWLLPLFLHGTGIRTNDLTPGHPSVSYTLTLPAPRFRLIWTRLVVAGGSATLLQALLLGLDAATLVLLGHAVPLGGMAIAGTSGVLLMLAIVVVFGLANAWDDRIGYTTVPLALFVLAVVTGSRTVALLGSGTLPWTAVIVMSLAIGTSLALTGLVARIRDF